MNLYFQTEMRNLLDLAIIAFGDGMPENFVAGIVCKWKKIVDNSVVQILIDFVSVITCKH